MNSKKLILQLKKDFIDLADNYDSLYLRLAGDKNLTIQKFNKIKDIYKTNDIIALHIRLYYKNPKFIENLIEENEELWGYVLWFLYSNEYFISMDLSSNLINNIIKMAGTHDSIGRHYFTAYIATQENGFIKYKTKKTYIDLDSIYNQLLRNKNCMSHLLLTMEKFYSQDVFRAEESYLSYIVKIIKSHANYKGAASLILENMQNIYGDFNE